MPNLQIAFKPKAIVMAGAATIYDYLRLGLLVLVCFQFDSRALAQPASYSNEFALFQSEVEKFVANKQFKEAKLFLDNSSPLELAKSQKQHGRPHLAIRGYGLDIPGVTSRHHETLHRGKVWIFPGIGDVFVFDQHEMAWHGSAMDFAERYNLYLDYFSGEELGLNKGIESINAVDLVEDSNLIFKFSLETIRKRYAIDSDSWKSLSLESKLRIRLDLAQQIEFALQLDKRKKDQK